MAIENQEPQPLSAATYPGVGFRIRLEIDRPEAAVVAGFREFETPAVSDLMNRLYTMDTRIHNLTPGLRVLGTACTVKCFPGDNLMVHKSLDVACPGDVLVIDASASTMTAVAGDIISTKARHRGIAGLVVNGLVRDLPGIRNMGDFPVFAIGVTPMGPLHRGPGEINYPVCAGGIVVHPGDVVMGDESGVVVIPSTSAAALLARLQAVAAADTGYIAAVTRGEFSNAWVDEILRQHGLPDVAL
jgi:RraA family protein